MHVETIPTLVKETPEGTEHKIEEILFPYLFFYPGFHKWEKTCSEEL